MPEGETRMPRPPWWIRELSGLVTLSWALFGVLAVVVFALFIDHFRHTGSIDFTPIHGHRHQLSGGLGLFLAITVELYALAYGVCCLYVFRLLRAREHRRRIIIVAALNCLLPHGLLLGVATIIVVMHPAIRRQFERSASRRAAKNATPAASLSVTTRDQRFA